MVDIRRLWNNGKFQQLSVNAKLIYVYLSNNSGLNTVGVVCLSPESASQTIGMDIDSYRSAVKELVDTNYIFVKAYDGLIYFIVPAHFSTLATNDNTIEKIKSDLASLPSKLKTYLASIGIAAEKKYKKFNKPTVQEIEQVGMEFGYAVNGKDFFDYYENISKEQGKTVFWVDSNGTQIKDWKMKLKRVWCRPQNKLQKRDNAPKGFEFFFVNIDGKTYFPETWKDGEPRSKDFTIQRALQKKYEQVTKRG
jgi:hypothetical protein